MTRFVYNLEDRLSLVLSGVEGSGDLIAEYYYDPFGRRLWKQVGAARTYFHYSDQGLITEYDGAGFEVRAYGGKVGDGHALMHLWEPGRCSETRFLLNPNRHFLL